MTRRMLINAQNAEELRIAIVDGKTLENYQVEVADRSLTRGNIYRATVVNIQPSLNAAFLDYGAERHGFLAIQDVVPAVYRQELKGERPRIDKVLERGQSLMIQVVKDPEGQKGAAVTSNLSFAGRYLVFTPFDDMRGVSRKVEDEESRRRLKEIAAGLSIPQGGGVIIRTNALDQNKTTLGRDLAELLRLWRRIKSEGGRGKGAKLLYSDQDLILRALRDYLDNAIDEVLVDDEEALGKARQYLRAVMPRTKMRLERYSERAPLFARFDLDNQIERIYERRVDLPSGGSLVIDRTEALTAIDVNSGKATRASSQEETAVNTNLEAAAEVARQLRLRDLGGLVVVDFIDMRSGKNRRRVEKALRDAMKSDKARSTVGRLSSNGLLEVNRQKIQQALELRTHRACPTCGGTGRIASPEMVGLSLLRRIEARAATHPIRRVRIALHPELADAFQNSRRHQIAALEEEFDLKVEVIASNRLHRPEQEIEWFEREAGEVPKRRQEKPQAARLAVPEVAHGDASSGDEGGAAKRGRKRRRGGRKHSKPSGGGSDAEGKKQSAGSAGAQEEAVQDKHAIASAASPPTSGNGTEESKAAKPAARKRRRRGGRRHRSSGAKSKPQSPSSEGGGEEKS